MRSAPPGAYPTSTTGQPVTSLVASGVKVKDGGLISTGTVGSGQSVQLGMIGISPGTLTLLGARQARDPAAEPGRSPALSGATSRRHIRWHADASSR